MKEGYPYNLVIGLAGPYGAGCSCLAKELCSAVVDWPACRGEVIHVATLIHNSYDLITGDELDESETSESAKREILQKAGTNLRSHDVNIVGNLIATEIHKRGMELETSGNLKGIGTLVFIIDSLKNINDLITLRRIYSNEFYLIFVHANKQVRWQRMINYKSWMSTEGTKFDRCDDVDSDEKLYKPEVGDAGQQIRRLAAEADYYIVNDKDRDTLKEEGNRFLELYMGSEYNQPTMNERSMHIAYSVANRSCCLSRQVGAAITDDEGNILSVGHNDVPKAGGGLYYTKKNQIDNRCYNVGDRRCINDTNKEERFDQLEDEISACLSTPNTKSKNTISTIIKNSQFRESIEYCRGVHAEMEALMNMCRVSGCSTMGKIMYVTTQPCHNCAKHILCAGLKKVIYIEPYPKSLAKELHSDSIVLDQTNDECSDNKLAFIPYSGIAPHRYHDFFAMREERKDDSGRRIEKTKEQRAFKPRFAEQLWRRSRNTQVLDPINIREVEALTKFTSYIKNEAEEGGESNAEGAKQE